MNPKRKNSREQSFLGLKCVLLGLVVVISVAFAVMRCINPEIISAGLGLTVDITVITIVSIVLALDIKPFLELKNTGIRNIYREKDIEIENFGKFNKMVSQNTFRYHFQPIVDAHNGVIFAYEALMRSPEDVGLSPKDILKYAEISQQLYSIEYCTFYNTLRIYHENPEKFGGRKMFINSIPSVMLTEEDLQKIKREFGDIGGNTVVEILEDDEDTKESCTYFERLRELFGCRIAIDDYGSGYANEQKLLNNNPNFIKIDISLISSIDSDMKKQLLVSNIIKFAYQYGIKVLAEGVETKDEMQKLIELGVDFIQGYCCARPNAKIIQEIDPEIRDFIVEQNIRLSRFNNDRSKVYKAVDGETVSLLDLAVEKYGRVAVKSGTVTIVGEPNHTIDIVVTVKPGSESTINFRNVNITAPFGPSVVIGQGAKLTLNIEGENQLDKEGVFVPANASFTLCGKGSLRINGSRNSGVGIGGGFADEFGNITVDMEGSLDMICSGDKITCVGGGSQPQNGFIRFLRGDIKISGSGIQVVGVGCAAGGVCFTNTASLRVEISGNEAVGIGCRNGCADIEISGGSVFSDAGGDRVIAIGNFNGSSGKILLSGGRIETFAHGKDAVCVGSMEGGIDIVCGAEYIKACGEGTKARGIGNVEGGMLTVTGGTVCSTILAAEPCWFGNNGKNIVITGGNVVSNDMTYPLEAVNSFGEPLVPITVESDRFEKRLVTSKGEYMYRAVKIPEADYLRVYVPEGSLAE